MGVQLRSNAARGSSPPLLALLFVVKDIFSKCVNASLSTLAKLAVRLVTPVGSSTAWSMAFSQMGTCHQIRLLEMILSQPSSLKLGVVSMFQEPSSLILSRL